MHIARVELRHCGFAWVYKEEAVEGDLGPKEAVAMNNKIVRNGVLFAAGVLMAYGSPVLARAAGNAQEAGQTQTAPAQQNGPARPDLNLTDDQKAQMKKIHQDAKAQIEAVNSDSSLSADQKQAKIQGIRRQTHKQVESILTPEQKQQERAWRRAHQGDKPQQEAPPSN
jgi:Spy/CpxP family protein refolding chaperone